ncbi:putative leader peptide [Streptomyces sp. CA-135486]|uniref:putative leader peptide n=1 Tax=Streptomyces sp. CA-135486 TaxID=3240049 RepID=UPI003D8B804A
MPTNFSIRCPAILLGKPRAGSQVSRPHGSVRYARPITVPLTGRTLACWIGDMKMRLDLTRRRHVDLARVSSAFCCRVTA